MIGVKTKMSERIWKKRCKIALRFAGELAACLFLYPLAQCLYGHREIWLISERGNDARDNGSVFYRYLRENHPELEAYYVIARTSVDREKLENFGNLVDYRSLRHYLLFLGASKLISTHVMGMSPNREFFLWLLCRTNGKLWRGKTVFLQHGVIKDLMPEFFREHAKLDLFLCGAERECQFVREQFHYSPEAVQCTGLARFDRWCSGSPKRQLLIMPTWRMWLRHAPGDPQELLWKSDFRKAWNALLNSPRLEALLCRYDMTACFYPHPQMQPYGNLFQTTQAHVRIADSSQEDIQKLLRDSMLLITDFSSVFFDFAYMRKSILYYQFDEEAYRAGHYAAGYFDYRLDGFGAVVTEEDTLLDALEAALRKDCKVIAPYLQRMEAFFPNKDTENCERIYRAVKEHTCTDGKKN